MQRLTDEEFQVRAAPILQRIFCDVDPYGASFAAQTTIRKLCFPYDYVLPDDLLEGVAAASAHFGEPGFFVTFPVADLFYKQHICPDFAYDRYYRWDEVEEFQTNIDPVEHIILSSEGSWAAMCSDESHALFSCTPEVWPFIAEAVPDLDTQVFSFLSLWKEFQEAYGTRPIWRPPIWLPGLLNHVYGAEGASQIWYQWVFEQGELRLAE